MKTISFSFSYKPTEVKKEKQTNILPVCPAYNVKIEVKFCCIIAGAQCISVLYVHTLLRLRVYRIVEHDQRELKSEESLLDVGARARSSLFRSVSSFIRFVIWKKISAYMYFFFLFFFFYFVIFHFFGRFLLSLIKLVVAVLRRDANVFRFLVFTHFASSSIVAMDGLPFFFLQQPFRRNTICFATFTLRKLVFREEHRRGVS